jgi:hypothetical protein
MISYTNYGQNLKSGSIGPSPIFETMILYHNDAINRNTEEYALEIARTNFIIDLKEVMTLKWEDVLGQYPDNKDAILLKNNIDSYANNYYNGGINNFESDLDKTRQSITPKPLYTWEIHSALTSIYFLFIGFILMAIKRIRKWLENMGKTISVEQLNLITNGVLDLGGVAYFIGYSPAPLTSFQWLLAIGSIVVGFILTIKYDNPHKNKKKKR